MKKLNAVRLFSASVITSLFALSSAAFAAPTYVTVPISSPTRCPAGYTVWGNNKTTVTCKLISSTKPTPQQIAASKIKRAEQNNNQQNIITPLIPPSLNPPVETSTVQATTAKRALDPEGDIYIVTYVDTPNISTSNNHDRRLGGVRVKIQRDGGNESCSTHTSNQGLTNSTENRVGSDGKTHLVKGTIHFANCNASPGSRYTVTAIGRKGYTIESDASKSFSLSDNQTQRVSFVLKKNPPVKKTTTTQTSSGGLVVPN